MASRVGSLPFVPEEITDLGPLEKLGTYIARWSHLLGGGQVVSVLAFYSDDTSSNRLLKSCLKINKIEARLAHFFKKIEPILLDSTKHEHYAEYGSNQGW